MAKRSFNSNNHIYRPGSLGAAMAEAGVIETPHLIRDNKLAVYDHDKKRERLIPVRRTGDNPCRAMAA